MEGLRGLQSADHTVMPRVPGHASERIRVHRSDAEAPAPQAASTGSLASVGLELARERPVGQEVRKSRHSAGPDLGYPRPLVGSDVLSESGEQIGVLAAVLADDRGTVRSLQLELVDDVGARRVVQVPWSGATWSGSSVLVPYSKVEVLQQPSLPDEAEDDASGVGGLASFDLASESLDSSGVAATLLFSMRSQQATLPPHPLNRPAFDDELLSMLAQRADIAQQALAELAQVSSYRPFVVIEGPTPLGRRTPGDIPASPDVTQAPAGPRAARDANQVRALLSSFQSGSSRGRALAEPFGHGAASADSDVPEGISDAPSASVQGVSRPSPIQRW